MQRVVWREEGRHDQRFPALDPKPTTNTKPPLITTFLLHTSYRPVPAASVEFWVTESSHETNLDYQNDSHSLANSS